MTCLEAQSKIVSFIENKLSDDELAKFISHVNECDDCAEELEIYYTILVGMKKLDEEQNIDADFSLELKEKLKNESARISSSRTIKRTTAFLLLTVIVLFLGASYTNSLRVIYNDEQSTKKESQGTYYYYNTFGEYIYDEERDVLNETFNPVEPNKTFEFYKNIRKYNALNNSEGDKNE